MPVADDLRHIPFPALIGDVGGTNARFALIGDADAATRRFPDEQTANYPTIDDAIEHALTGVTARPRSALLALAGPITGDRVQLTNCDWIVEPKGLIERFGLAEVILLNDFEALSLSLAGIGPGDFDQIGGGTAAPDAARLVLGPGTGLGAGALIHAGGLWIPVPGEGGHIDFGPVTPRDMDIWPHIERHPGRISGETILCGPGLVRLYRAVAAANDRAARFATPSEVANAGLAATDPDASEALALFATYLGRFAGDIALVFVALGGVYLAGGISAKIAPALKTGAFRAAFIDKAPHNALLDRMATAIITKPDAALAGIAAFARAPLRFGVELGGKRWRG
jgi:glucokinase